jgi:hypothetical protein
MQQTTKLRVQNMVRIDYKELEKSATQREGRIVGVQI